MTMISPMLFILVVAIAILGFVVYNFGFLRYRIFPARNPVTGAKHISLKGPSLFISDLHLRADRSFPYSQSLAYVMKSRHVANLIVVGDLFDSAADARRILARDSLPITGVLGVDELPVKMFFVYGSPPHDPPQDEKALFDLTHMTLLGNCAILDFGNVRVIAYHGHDMSWEGWVGHAWDRFVSKLSLERTWKRWVGVAPSDWVIFGHTHIPGIDAEHRVANCGGWQCKGFLVRPACTGIFLSPEKGSLEIVHFAK